MNLTNDMRDIIVSGAIRDVFAARNAKITKVSNQLAMLAYERLYPTSVQMKMDALPDEFFHQTSTIYVYLPEAKAYRREPVAVNLISSRKISANDHGYRTPVCELDRETALSERIRKFQKDSEKLQADKDSFKRELAIFLKGFSTLKKLETSWSEGKQYYKQFIGMPTKNVPSILPDNINLMMSKLRGDQ